MCICTIQTSAHVYMSYAHHHEPALVGIGSKREELVSFTHSDGNHAYLSVLSFDQLYPLCSILLFTFPSSSSMYYVFPPLPLSLFTASFVHMHCPFSISFLSCSPALPLTSTYRVGGNALKSIPELKGICV